MAAQVVAQFAEHPWWRTYPTALDDFLTLLQVDGIGPRRADWILVACGTVRTFLDRAPEVVAQSTRGRLSARFIACLQDRVRRLCVDGPVDRVRPCRGRSRATSSWRTRITAVDDYLDLQRVRGIGRRRAEIILMAYGSIGAFLMDTAEGVETRTEGRIRAAIAARLLEEARRIGLSTNWCALRELLEAEAMGSASTSIVVRIERAFERPRSWLRVIASRVGARAEPLRHLLRIWSATPTAHHG
jgi:hypothetical protein